MAELKVRAWKRSPGGKGAAKRLRANGRIPAIVYAKEMASIPVELDSTEVFALTHGAHAASLESMLVSVEIQDDEEKSPRPTLITEIQHDPIKGNVLHMDFHQVSLTEKIHARIPIVTMGESQGVAAGGILEHGLRELEVRCLAKDLPEEIRVDISEVDVGEALHVKDIVLAEEIEVLSDRDLTIVSVTMPRVVVEEVPAEAVEEVEEPEVIGEKREETEGAEEERKGGE